MYKRQIYWSYSPLYQQHSLCFSPLQLYCTVTMNIGLFFVFTVISLGLTKRHKPALPAHIPATSLNMSDPACSSKSLTDKEIRQTKAMLDTETWFHPCDCGGPGWEKIVFYDFSQQECPPDINRLYGIYNNVSCHVNISNNRYKPYHYSSLPLPVEGRSYSSVYGRIRGHGWGRHSSTLFI